MRIALINPPYRHDRMGISNIEPIGLGYIKSYLNFQNIECDLYDFSCTELTDEELINKYKLNEYKFLGFASYTISFRQTISLISLIKFMNQSVKIIVGGHHVTLNPEFVLKEFSCIDYIVAGFGEETTYQLINSIANENDISQIAGIGYRIGKNIIFNAPDFNNIKIDLYPFPERHVIRDTGHSIIHKKSDDVINISTSRGCPYTCYYCVNSNNKKWFKRSVDNVISEIKELYYKYSFKHIFFIDCNFLIDVNRAYRIIENIYKLDKNITLNFQVRSDQIVDNEIFFYKISKLGCTHINVGIESNSNSVLERFNKLTTPEINQKAVDILKEFNIQPIVFIIMFDALTTLKDLEDNFTFLKNNGLTNINNINTIYTSLMPFRGTPYYDKYNKYYEAKIHEVANPIFQDPDVKKFFQILSDFRNIYEDNIHSQLVAFKEYFNRSKEQNQCFKSVLLAYEFTVKFQYIFFELLLNHFLIGNKDVSIQDIISNDSISNVLKIIENGIKIIEGVSQTNEV